SDMNWMTEFPQSRISSADGSSISTYTRAKIARANCGWELSRFGRCPWARCFDERRRGGNSEFFVQAYASPDLVYPRAFNRRSHSEIGAACPYDHLLDHRPRYHRFRPRRGRHPHVRAASKQTLSSCRPHPLHAGCNPCSVPLHQISHPFPARWIGTSEQSYLFSWVPDKSYLTLSGIPV